MFQQIVFSNAVLFRWMVGSGTMAGSGQRLRCVTPFRRAHSPKLLGVGGGPAVSGVACGALATGSGDFALGGDSFAIFESSFFGF